MCGCSLCKGHGCDDCMDETKELLFLQKLDLFKQFKYSLENKREVKD